MKVSRMIAIMIGFLLLQLHVSHTMNKEICNWSPISEQANFVIHGSVNISSVSSLLDPLLTIQYSHISTNKFIYMCSIDFSSTGSNPSDDCYCSNCSNDLKQFKINRKPNLENSGAEIRAVMQSLQGENIYSSIYELPSIKNIDYTLEADETELKLDDCDTSCNLASSKIRRCCYSHHEQCNSGRYTAGVAANIYLGDCTEVYLELPEKHILAVEFEVFERVVKTCNVTAQDHNASIPLRKDIIAIGLVFASFAVSLTLFYKCYFKDLLRKKDHKRNMMMRTTKTSWLLDIGSTPKMEDHDVSNHLTPNSQDPPGLDEPTTSLHSHGFSKMKTDDIELTMDDKDDCPSLPDDSVNIIKLSSLRGNILRNQANELFYGDETDIHKHWIDCKKNPGHNNNIPVNDFNLNHLPLGCRDVIMFELIKALSALTVLIKVKYTSVYRPKYGGSLGGQYPFYNTRESDVLRTGTGRVRSVVKYTESDNKGTCPCGKCKHSDAPSKLWGEVRVVTATHVVFDDIEVRQTRCVVGFDDDKSPGVSLDGWEVGRADIARDWCDFTCVSCDLDVVDKLHKMCRMFDDLYKEVENKYGRFIDVNNMTVIVSHPHGCPKQVSVGKWAHNREIEDCACPGSSGAFIYKPGHSRRLTNLHIYNGEAVY